MSSVFCCHGCAAYLHVAGGHPLTPPNSPQNNTTALHPLPEANQTQVRASPTPNGHWSYVSSQVLGSDDLAILQNTTPAPSPAPPPPSPHHNTMLQTQTLPPNNDNTVLPPTAPDIIDPDQVQSYMEGPLQPSENTLEAERPPALWLQTEQSGNDQPVGLLWGNAQVNEGEELTDEVYIAMFARVNARGYNRRDEDPTSVQVDDNFEFFGPGSLAPRIHNRPLPSVDDNLDNDDIHEGHYTLDTFHRYEH